MPKIKLIITPEKEKIIPNVIISGQVLPIFIVNPNLRALIKRHYFDTGKILKIEGVKIEVLKYE